MNTDYAMSLGEEVNSRLEPADVLGAIDFHADKMHVTGTTVKAFCPIHKDSRFRSLLVDAERRAFRCTIKTCPGYAGGSLLDLYALSRGITHLTAAVELVQRMELEIEPGWREQLVESYLAEAGPAVERGDYTEAESLLRELITVIPDLPEARVLLASVHAGMGDTHGAAEEYTQIIDQYMSAGRLEEADSVAGDALQKFPDNEDLLFVRVKVAEARGNTDVGVARMQEIIVLREAANRQMDNIGLLEQLVQKVPDNPDFMIKLGGLYELQHNVRGASRQYENAAKLYLGKGQKAEGIELLEKVLQFNGENVKARLELAAHLAELGEIDRARDHTFRAINQQIDQQEFGSAISTVNMWLEREPGNIDCRELTARVYLDQDRPDEAAKFLLQGAELATASGDHSRAAQLLLRAKFLIPDAVDLRHKLIQEFRTTGEEQRAAFEMVDLAEILFALEQPDEAVKVLLEGLSTDISIPLKLQMIGALANHGKAELAQGPLRELVTSAEATGTPAELADLYDTLSQLDPANAQLHLQHVQALWKVNPAQAADAAVGAAQTLITSGHNREAAELLEYVVSQLEDYVPAAPRLFELCETCKRIDLAGHVYQVSIQELADQDAEAGLKAARRMIALDPAHPSAASDIAFLLATLGKSEEAAEQYAKVANLLRESGDLESALTFAREAATLNPESMNALAMQALLARELLPQDEMDAMAQEMIALARSTADPGVAAVGYATFAELYPDNDTVLSEAVQALEALNATEAVAQLRAIQASRLSATGDWEGARNLLAKAATAAPRVASVHEQLGEACVITGDHDAGAIAFAAASSAYARIGDVDNAVRCAESARQAGPTSSAAWEAIFRSGETIGFTDVTRDAARHLSRLYAQSGPAASTARWAREWVRLADGDGEAHDVLGAALLTIDQPEDAARELSVAASLYAEDSPEKALNALTRLGSRSGLSRRDRKTLESLLKDQRFGSAVHIQASQLLGTYLVHSDELGDARKIAEDLPVEQSAVLWTLIAQKESEPAASGGDYLRAAQALQSAGDVDAAIDRLITATRGGKAPIEAYVLTAELLTGTGRLEEAAPFRIHAVQQAASEKADELPALVAAFRNDYQDNIDARTALAKVLLKHDPPAMALEELEGAAQAAIEKNDIAALVDICGLDEDLTRKSAILTGARADTLMGMQNVEQALEWVSTSGREMLEAGKASEALDMAGRWISLAAKEPEAYRLQAEAYAATGKVAEAHEARIALASLLAGQDQNADALIELDNVLIEAPAHERALRLKADLQRNAGDAVGAAGTLAVYGDQLLAARETEKALAAFRESLTLNENQPDVLWTVAGIVREREGADASRGLYRRWSELRRVSVDQTQWIEDLKQLLGLVPDSVGLLRDLTNALLAVGRPQDAEPHLLSLVELLETEGDFAGAAETLETALAHRAVVEPEQLVRVGQLYKQANNASFAQDYLRRAGMAFKVQGRNEEAVDAFEALLKLAGDKALPEDFAMAAAAYGAYGDSESALRLIDQGLDELQKQSSNQQRRELLLSHALEIAPLNGAYVLAHLDLLPTGRALTEGLHAAREMTAAGDHEAAIRVLTYVITLAPHDMSLRQEIFEPLRRTGNVNRLRQELLALTSDAIAAGDVDSAIASLDEATTLAVSAQQFRVIAELNERARRPEQSAEHYARSAMLFAEDGKNEQAIASINRAISASPSAFPAEAMATLVRKLGPDVYDVAREQLRYALTARRHKQSQLLALALIDTADAERSAEILQTVYTLGGSTFVIGIARERINYLLDQKNITGALELSRALMEITPDYPDAWFLAARINRLAGNSSDARRAGLEAARLYQTAGAVIEEEEAYGEALAAEPKDLSVKSTFAEYLIREHREAEAVPLLREIISAAEAGQDTDVLLDSLNRAVQVAPNDSSLREKLATTLESIAPDSAIEHWLQLATLYHNKKQYDDERSTYRHVLTLHPQNETALQGQLNHATDSGDLDRAARYTIALADVKVTRKNVGEACRIYQSYLKLDPDNLDMLERLAALSGTSNDTEVFSTTTRALARKFQKLGDNERALRHYEALHERQPRDASVLSALLDCCAAAGNAEKGLTYARQLLAIARETEDPERIRLAATTILNYDDEDATAHNDLGEALLSLNRVPQAMTEWMRAAELFEGGGNTAAAFTCYRRITQISPGTVQAWRRLADLAFAVGDTDTARKSLFHLVDMGADGESMRLEPLLSRLLQAYPTDPELHEMALEIYTIAKDLENGAGEYAWLANYYEQIGETEKAAKLLNTGLAFAPENAQLKAAHYELVRKLGRLEELQQQLRQAIEKHKKNGKIDEAIAALHELEGISPGQISVHRDRAILLDQQGRNEEALQEHLHVIQLLLDRSELEQAREHAEAVAQKYPETSDCRVRLADVLARGAYPDLAAKYYQMAAEFAIREQDLEQAIALLNKAAIARPAWVEVREMLATVCEKAGKADEAFQVRIGLVQTLVEAGDLGPATTTLDQLSRQRPESPEIREQLAGLHQRTGNHEEQVRVLQELADLHQAAGDATKALDVYRKLVAIMPDDAGILARYVEILSQADVPAEELPDEYARLADALAGRGDFEAASQTYEQAIGLAPENTAARSRYATFLLSHGSRHKALAEMRTLAKLYTEREDPLAAIEVLNAALNISPRDADLCLALATAQDAAGLHEDARVSYARASAILASTAAVKGIDTYRRILSQDENNTAVRLRLVELLIKSGDKMEAAREARLLSEIHISRGELEEAEHAYSFVDDCEPESLDDIREAIRRDSYDPSLQYVHFVRLGNRQFECGDVDAALDAYRTARSLHDDQPDLIQKCIDCVSLIAPEAEAIPDYLLLAEKLLMTGDLGKARQVYDKVRLIDPFNNDAKCGLETVNAAERKKAAIGEPSHDEFVLKTTREVSKRVALMDLLAACNDAAQDPKYNSDSQKLG